MPEKSKNNNIPLAMYNLSQQLRPASLFDLEIPIVRTESLIILPLGVIKGLQADISKYLENHVDDQLDDVEYGEEQAGRKIEEDLSDLWGQLENAKKIIKKNDQ